MLLCRLTQINFIESIDTSNPIIHGIMGVSYNDYGLNKKISTKIDTIHETQNKDIIYHNIKQFKKLLTNYS